MQMLKEQLFQHSAHLVPDSALSGGIIMTEGP